jgi:hypothetical protein
MPESIAGAEYSRPGLLRLRSLLGDASPEAVVLAVAVPFVFLHTHYQPHLHAGAVDVGLTDLAILGVVTAAAVAGARHGFGRLAAGRAVWLTAAFFLALVLVSLVWAKAIDPTYPIPANLVSALKFCEYALLAPAAALILRRAEDRRPVYFAVAAWAAVLAIVAVAQFLGYVDQLDGHKPNGREPSLLGEHDFAGAALTLGLAGILFARRRVALILGGVAGTLGVAVAAALDSVGGMWLALVGLWAVARPHGVAPRRLAATVGVCVVATIGAVTIRGPAIGSFLRFVGLESENQRSTSNVQTYAHRTLLAYIGIEIWLRHPVAGVGWQASKRPHAFDPILPAARRHFASKQPPEAFPSPTRMWGVQNGIIQTLADLGIVGLLALAGIGVAVARVIVTAARHAPRPRLFDTAVALGWILFGFADVVGSGLLAGLAGESELWIGIGLAVALAAEARCPNGDTGTVRP